MSVTAPISAITRGSLHDGDGVRTVVYVKGCPLRCRWCHNPETWNRGPELLYAPHRCIGCGRCMQVCPEHHRIQNGKMILIREDCVNCGRCAQVCPTEALQMCGEETDVETVFRRVLADKHYYIMTGGGVTVSGGECLLYPAFTAELLRLCREAGIGTALETALYVPEENLLQVLPHAQRVYADLKIVDGAKHRQYTGCDNAGILQNLHRLTQLHTDVVVRIPVIPGVNDTPTDQKGFSGILRELGPGLKGVELLRYNVLGASKYTLLGKTWEAFSTQAQSDDQMLALCRYLQEALPARIPVQCRDCKQEGRM